MVQILPPPVLFLFVLVVPAFSVPLPTEDVNDIALRELSNELISRKVHVHLPKIHLPKVHLPHMHIDGKEVLEGLKKWAPKIGKAIFKIATKLILREEELEASEFERRDFDFDPDSSLAKRDIDGSNDTYELIARSPKKGKTLKKLLKATKKMKKYAKKFAKAELKLAADSVEMNQNDANFVRRSEFPDVDDCDEDEEYYFVALELEGSGVDVREVNEFLEVLVRGLEDLTFEERRDLESHGRWLELEEGYPYGRDDDEDVYERQSEWELEDLD